MKTVGLVTVLMSLLAVVPTASAQDFESAIRAGDYARARAEIERALRERPDDPALRYRLASVLAYSGATEAALAEYDSLLSLHPNDADYRLGRAQMALSCA